MSRAFPAHAFAAAFVLCSIAGCANDRTVYAPTASRPQRGYPPSAAPGPALARDTAPGTTRTLFATPTPQEVVLPNGLRVVVLERHGIPFVTVQLVTLAGEEDGPAGVARIVGNALFTGTTTREPIALNQGFSERASQHFTRVSNLTTTIELRAPTPNLGGVLERAADVAANAQFSDEALDRSDLMSPLQRSRAIASAGISGGGNDPGTLAERALDRIFDPGLPSDADARIGVEKTPRQALVDFHRQHFVPGRSLLVIVGELSTKDVIRDVTKYFSAWKGDAPALVAARPVPIKNQSAITIVDRKGSQAQVLVGAWVPNDPLSVDWRCAVAYRDFLGGSFGSRLFRAIRESGGNTYGVYARLDRHRAYARLSVGGAIQTDKTVDTLEAIVKELTRFGTEPPTIDELGEEHSRSAVANYSTNQGAAADLSTLIHTREEPLDQFMKRRLARFEVPPTEDLMRVAKTYLSKDHLQIAIVGDAKKLEPELKAKGFTNITVQ